MRFADKTEFTLNFQGSDSFEIELKTGQVWANVTDVNLKLRGGNLLANLNQSTLDFKREDQKNVLTGIKHNTKVELLSSEKAINSLYLPAFTQITAYDKNISENYAKLKTAKLRKELRFAHLDQAILEKIEWNQKNFDSDLTFVQDVKSNLFQKHSDVLFLDLNTQLQNLAENLVFNSKKQNLISFNSIKNLYNTAFYFAGLGEKEKAEGKIVQIEALLNQLNDSEKDLLVQDLTQIYAGYNFISYADDAYFVKAHLKKAILALLPENQKINQEEFFFLDEIKNFEDSLRNYNLYSANLSVAKIVLEGIVQDLEQKKALITVNPNLLNIIREISYYNLLSNLTVLDEFLIEKQAQLELLSVTIAPENQKSEMQLEILNKRITLTNALINIRKYNLAKLVTEVGVNDFIAQLQDKEVSVVDYFLLLQKDLDNKITYIQKDLHGTAPLNEKQYQTDLAEKEAIEKAYNLYVKYQTEDQANN